MKWIKVLNIRHDTLKVLHENKRKQLLNTGLSDDILDITPRVQNNKKVKISKWGYIEQKNFSIANETINKMEEQPT